MHPVVIATASAHWPFTVEANDKVENNRLTEETKQNNQTDIELNEKN